METALSPQQTVLARKLLRLFKINGIRADLVATPGQVELFGRIIFKVSLRQLIITETQYGKSLFVAFAVIILIGLDKVQGDKVIVVAPTDDKAHIIMRYVTEHLGDSPLFAPLLSADTKVEKLRQTTTKDALVLKNGGMLFVFTANAGDSKKGIEAAMGEGAEDVILDEGCLVPDPHEATIFRMIIGRKEGMYVKIGNPFYRGTHFQRSYRDPNYLKLVIDCHQAKREGRITQEVLDEARSKPFFDILYECKFPTEQQLDAKGYTILVKEALLDIAYLVTPLPLMGEKHIGADVAHGGANFSAIVVRGTNQAKLAFKAQTADELILLTEIEKIARKEGIPLCDRHIHGDKIGSAALWSRANELWPICTIHNHTNSFGVNVGERADPEVSPAGEPMLDEKTGKPVILFINKRAQLAWRMAEWLSRGGKVSPKPEFDELVHYRYKIQSDKRIKLKGKDEMAEEGIPSPDVGDALCLTFDTKPKLALASRFTQEPELPMTSFGI